MNYNNKQINYIAVSENYDVFYDSILQIVKNDWRRVGTEILGLSDSKVSRLFTGKQKDFDTLFKMAKFMGIKFEFIAKKSDPIKSRFF